jgi:hypothetical protein
MLQFPYNVFLQENNHPYLGHIFQWRIQDVWEKDEACESQLFQLLMPILELNQRPF